MAQIACFLFDIGNVLIEWNPDHLLRKILPDEEAVRRFRLEAITDARILELDRGQTWEEHLAEVETAAPHFLDAARIYRDRWVETIAGPIPEMVDLKAALREAGFPVYALSNYGVENFERTVPHYPFLNDFDGLVVSGYEGMVKPGADIYHLAIDRFGLIPEHTLFIDDRAENTETAARLGFQVHTFSQPKPLFDALSDAGVLPL